jgi:hypothetical protein
LLYGLNVPRNADLISSEKHSLKTRTYLTDVIKYMARCSSQCLIDGFDRLHELLQAEHIVYGLFSCKDGWLGRNHDQLFELAQAHCIKPNSFGIVEGEPEAGAKETNSGQEFICVQKILQGCSSLDIAPV